MYILGSTMLFYSVAFSIKCIISMSHKLKVIGVQPNETARPMNFLSLYIQNKNKIIDGKCSISGKSKPFWFILPEKNLPFYLFCIQHISWWCQSTRANQIDCIWLFFILKCIWNVGTIYWDLLSILKAIIHWNKPLFKCLANPNSVVWSWFTSPGPLPDIQVRRW